MHGKGHQQDCSSDNTIVSEQISDFSTDQAKYVATDQMHGGQDMTHDHPFDQEKLATVGDKADQGTSSSPKLQLKIMPRQPTKILGGQEYPSHESNSSNSSTRSIFVLFLQALTGRIFTLEILIHRSLE